MGGPAAAGTMLNGFCATAGLTAVTVRKASINGDEPDEGGDTGNCAPKYVGIVGRIEERSGMEDPYKFQGPSISYFLIFFNSRFSSEVLPLYGVPYCRRILFDARLV